MKIPDIDLLKVVDGTISGVVSGIAAGLILAFFFSWQDGTKEQAKKAEQIDYISRFLSTTLSQKRICSRVDLHGIKDNAPIIARGAVTVGRKVAYIYARRQFDKILDGRTSALNFDEIESLRTAFNFGDFLIEYNYRFSDGLCPIIFKDAESIKWLNLADIAVQKEPCTASGVGVSWTESKALHSLQNPD